MVERSALLGMRRDWQLWIWQNPWPGLRAVGVQMSNTMTNTCMTILARAYYGLELIGNASQYVKHARSISIKGCLKNQWITPEHQITEQGLWELRRAVNKQRRKIGTQ